jgi:hypothetical protein
MVCAIAKQVVNGAVARYLRDLYWSLCLHESWAANQLGTFSSKLHGLNWLQVVSEIGLDMVGVHCNRCWSIWWITDLRVRRMWLGGNFHPHPLDQTWVFVFLNTLSPFFTSPPASSHSFPHTHSHAPFLSSSRALLHRMITFQWLLLHAVVCNIRLQ